MNALSPLCIALLLQYTVLVHAYSYQESISNENNHLGLSNLIPEPRKTRSFLGSLHDQHLASYRDKKKKPKRSESRSDISKKQDGKSEHGKKGGKFSSNRGKGKGKGDGKSSLKSGKTSMNKAGKKSECTKMSNKKGKSGKHGKGKHSGDSSSKKSKKSKKHGDGCEPTMSPIQLNPPTATLSPSKNESSKSPTRIPTSATTTPSHGTATFRPSPQVNTFLPTTGEVPPSMNPAGMPTSPPSPQMTTSLPTSGVNPSANPATVPTSLPSPEISIFVPTLVPVASPTTTLEPTATFQPTFAPTLSSPPLPTFAPITTQSPSQGGPSAKKSPTASPSPSGSIPTRVPSSIIPSDIPSHVPTISFQPNVPSPSPFSGGTPTEKPTMVVNVPSILPSIVSPPAIGSPSVSPALSPTVAPGPLSTGAPSAPPIATPTSASEPPSPTNGLVVQATPFSLTYELSGGNPTEADFKAVEDAAISYLESYLRQQLELSAATQIEDVVGLSTGNGVNPISTDFSLQVVFSSSSEFIPDTDSLNNLVEAAFSPPADQDFLTILRALPSSNPFSMTSSVTYGTAAVSAVATALIKEQTSGEPDESNGDVPEVGPIQMAPATSASQPSPMPTIGKTPTLDIPAAPAVVLNPAVGLPLPSHGVVVQATPFFLIFEDAEGDPTLEEFAEAQDAVLSYLESYIKKKLELTSLFQVDYFVGLSTGEGLHPVHTSFSLDVIFRSTSRFIPPTERIDLLIKSAFLSPTVDTFMSMLRSFPSDCPFSQTSSVTYGIGSTITTTQVASAGTGGTTDRGIRQLGTVLCVVLLAALAGCFITCKDRFRYKRVDSDYHLPPMPSNSNIMAFRNDEYRAKWSNARAPPHDLRYGKTWYH